MKARHFAFAIVSLLLVGRAAVAGRQLERTEILQVFEQLTSQPRKTWIPAGAIEATHQEYRAPMVTDVNEISRQVIAEIQRYREEPNKREITDELQKLNLDAIPFNVRHRLSNEYTMTSNVLIRFDGDRFYWEINVDSRIDSVKPGKDLAGNFMTEHFDLGANRRRVFAWDGDKYTTYFLPGNQAIVDARAATPHPVNGPLTAGLVPWGYGHYTYSNLCAAESSGVEKTVDGQLQIELTVKEADGTESQFLLDPAKSYAVTSFLTKRPDASTVSREYSDYELVAGKWVPKTILIEQFETGSERLMTRDLWNLSITDGNIPQESAFDVPYESDAMVEYHPDERTRPASYRYSNAIDTDRLLAAHLAISRSGGTEVRNCATVAAGYVASKLGVTITEQDLASLATQANGATSMYDLKYFMQGIGFYCRAVRTDIQTLKKLTGCKAILHIPGKSHFVVVDHIDDQYIWLIDLAANKFYYRTDVSFFDMDWTEGTALLVSQQPINAELEEISSDQLVNIIGGAGYSCTKLLQEYNVIFCSYMGGLCGGYYYEYYERWGCEAATSGSCTGTSMVRYRKTPCIDAPDLIDCVGTGEWTIYNMRACA